MKKSSNEKILDYYFSKTTGLILEAQTAAIKQEHWNMQNCWNYGFVYQLRKLKQLHVNPVTLQASIFVCLVYFLGWYNIPSYCTRV